MMMLCTSTTGGLRGFAWGCSFSTKATKPDGTSWVDAIQVADGHWAPDGQGIAVSDVAGQWHLFGLPGATNFMQAACYDQFFSSDYGRLRRDANHYVVDDMTQQPPHLRSSECALALIVSSCCMF